MLLQIGSKQFTVNGLLIFIKRILQHVIGEQIVDCAEQRVNMGLIRVANNEKFGARGRLEAAQFKRIRFQHFDSHVLVRYWGQLFCNFMQTVERGRKRQVLVFFNGTLLSCNIVILENVISVLVCVEQRTRWKMRPPALLKMYTE